MTKDYETFDCSSKRNKRKPKDNDDFVSMCSDLLNGINWKVSLFIFILGMFIFSDVFIEVFLLPIDKAVEGDIATSKGTIIQLLSLTFGYILIDLLVQGEIL
jgi:hypothetical protein